MVTETAALVQSVSPTINNVNTNVSADSAGPQRRTSDNRRVNIFSLFFFLFVKLKKK